MFMQNVSRKRLTRYNQTLLIRTLIYFSMRDISCTLNLHVVTVEYASGQLDNAVCHSDKQLVLFEQTWPTNTTFDQYTDFII